MDRRGFLKLSAIAVTALAVPAIVLSDGENEDPTVIAVTSTDDFSAGGAILVDSEYILIDKILSPTSFMVRWR